MARYAFENDPKRLGFTLARYKHTAKLLSGKRNVLEVGCSDGFGSRIVRQHVGRLTALDIDPIAIEEAEANSSPSWPIEFRVYDFLSAPVTGFDAVYALDVFEHIPDDAGLLARMREAADVAIIGTPSLESQRYASPLSMAGHINCKSGEELRAAMAVHWRHVFMFGLNDETFHTGFLPMAQYLFAMGVA